MMSAAGTFVGSVQEVVRLFAVGFPEEVLVNLRDCRVLMGFPFG
jgi:hypothetical protein